MPKTQPKTIDKTPAKTPAKTSAKTPAQTPGQTSARGKANGKANSKATAKTTGKTTGKATGKTGNVAGDSKPKHGPSIQDDERYEALRRDGASKEKAARIANTPRDVAAARGGHSPKYEVWTKEELYREAQEVGIDGRSNMSKDELIDALRHH